MKIDRVQKITNISKCFISLNYVPCFISLNYVHTAHKKMDDDYIAQYVDVWHIRDIVADRYQMLVCTMAPELKEYIKNNMLYGDNWSQYYVQICPGEIDGNISVFVNYSQIIGSCYIGEFPLSDLLKMIG